MEELIKIMLMECALDYDNADHEKETVEDIVNTIYDRYREQLFLYGVVGQSEQLVCCCDNPNAFKEMEEGKETCSKCEKPY